MYLGPEKSPPFTMLLHAVIGILQNGYNTKCPFILPKITKIYSCQKCQMNSFWINELGTCYTRFGLAALIERKLYLGAGFLVSTLMVQPFLPSEGTIDKDTICNRYKD